MATHSGIPAWSIAMGRGALWATVHSVTKCGTWLSVSTTTFKTINGRTLCTMFYGILLIFSWHYLGGLISKLVPETHSFSITVFCEHFSTTPFPHWHTLLPPLCSTLWKPMWYSAIARALSDVEWNKNNQRQNLFLLGPEHWLSFWISFVLWANTQTGTVPSNPAYPFFPPPCA